MVWATAVSVAGYYLSYGMWGSITKKEKKGALSMKDGLYYLALGLEMAAGSAIAGWALGEQVA